MDGFACSSETPTTSGWLIGFACDLMLVHGAQGRPGASVLFGKMETLLQDMQALRECEQREGKPPAPLGRWLNSAVHKICAAHAIPTPRDRKAAGAYA